MTSFLVKNPKIVNIHFIESMNAGLSSLHKILKDETRSKIILLLNEKGSLSYTELRNILGITSTGTMNYHLKVLSYLIYKNGLGLYMITEKGRLASQLLIEFSDKTTSFQTYSSLPRWLLIMGVAVSAVFLTGLLALYVRGIIDFPRLILYEFIAASALVVFVISKNAQKIRAKWSRKRQMSVNEVIYITFGALAGMTILMLGGSLFLYSLQAVLQSIGTPFILFPFVWWATVSLIFGPIIGGYMGYLTYKKSKYSDINFKDTEDLS